jgi:N-acetylneuraminic acid mutarotase
VIGGGNSSEQSVVQQWSGGAWHIVGHLPTTRSDLVAATTGGKTFVLGGYDGVTPAVGSVLSSSDGHSWTTVGSLAVPLRYAATAVVGSTVWLFGGEASGTESDVVQTFDTATGKGQVVAHLPSAIGHASAFRFQDKFLILGGRTDASSGAMTDQMWWFDPGTGKFTDAGRLPYVLADAAIVTGGDFAYVVGGESPHPISTILRIAFTKE